MENGKFTKVEIASVLNGARESMAKCRVLLDAIVPSIEGSVMECIKRSAGRVVKFPASPSRKFLLRDADVIISAFGSYIKLFFIDEDAVSGIRKSMLTEEERDDGMWDVIQQYRRKELYPKEFARMIDVECVPDVAICVTTEPSPEDVGVIAQMGNVDFSVEGARFCLSSGGIVWAEVSLSPDAEQT